MPVNLHVTNDTYGLYPLEIAKRIKESGKKNTNLMVNLSKESTFTDNIITYIPISKKSFENYLEKIDSLDKIIFHPYTYYASRFLKIVKKKFPYVKAYWFIWSYELYSLPPLSQYYAPFAKKYIKDNRRFPERIKENEIIGKLVLRFCHLIVIKKNYIKDKRILYCQ